MPMVKSKYQTTRSSVIWANMSIVFKDISDTSGKLAAPILNIVTFDKFLNEPKNIKCFTCQVELKLL